MIGRTTFFNRFWIYQKERFPMLVHGVMILAFTFSAIAYSRISRGAEGFVPIGDFCIAVYMSFSLFFILRILDEFKDREEDKRYRAYLPVPRGLVTLAELGRLGLVLLATQLFLLSFFQSQMLSLYIVVLAYMYLMYREFFAPKWLKSKQILYAFSHMLIIPLIDFYASGIDWRLNDGTMHLGIAWFVSVSFFNGMSLEIGRKIKTPSTEEVGVVSYSKLYGSQGATLLWLALLTVTMLLAVGAMRYGQFQFYSYPILVLGYILTCIPALAFLRNQTPTQAKRIELAAGIWTILMYLCLGSIPMLKTFL